MDGRLLNVIDVEATCWDGPVPRGMANEIIEIGLTVVDLEAGERIAKHQIVVRPNRSTVSAFCTELTGWTQDEVAAGVSFAEACRELAETHQARLRPWASWGDYDRLQFTSQCKVTRTAYPFGPEHTNAKRAFADALGLRKRPGMAQALQSAGLPLEGRHHNGADDAWNIAALVLYVRERERESAARAAADG